MVLLGSCFSDNLGAAFELDRVPVLYNPFGVVFHPLAMVKLLQRAIEKRYYAESDLRFEDRYYYSLEHHSALVTTSASSYLDQANALLDHLLDWIKEAKYLVLTFGSAWGYEFEGEVAANCHKQDPRLFEKKLYSYTEMGSVCLDVIRQIQELNPALTIAITVSPVLHLKDGWEGNEESKSHLVLLSSWLTKTLDNVYYLPVYEYVTRFLRSYEYFESDGTHPNQQAISMIYQWVSQSIFSQRLNEQVERWKAIRSSLNHKTLKPLSNANFNFKKKLLSELLDFIDQFGVNLDEEVKKLESEIQRLEGEVNKLAK